MNTEKYTRATFVLDRHTASGLHYVSEAMGVSASELVRGLLEQPVEIMETNIRAAVSGGEAERAGALRSLDLFAADALASLDSSRGAL